jgi:hypothetical protein
MTLKNFHSKRQYVIAFIEGEAAVNDTLSLEQIYNTGKSDWEYLYAIQDKIDYILDLKVGERLEMNFNRDNTDSRGLIKRIK